MPCAIPAEISFELLNASTGFPTNGDEPVFSAPWEAQAFAIMVNLLDRGVFTAHEWADTLSRSIRRAQAEGDADAGDTYYLHWLGALEEIVREKSLVTGNDLTARQNEWRVAAERTPHGQPILLQAASDISTQA